MNLTKTFAFPDHHEYSEEDFKIINNEKSDTLVTTEKDYNRIDNNQKKNVNLLRLIWRLKI